MNIKFSFPVKVARVVKWKLAFMEWLFVWKIENIDELQLPQSLIYFAEILHTFPTYQCLQRGVRDFF